MNHEEKHVYSFPFDTVEEALWNEKSKWKIGLGEIWNSKREGLENQNMDKFEKTFFLSKDWEERKIFICLEAVPADFSIWVNEKNVGHSHGSMMPIEYDITQLVCFEADNRLKIEVSDDTKVLPFLKGTFKDVFIYGESEVYIKDYFIRTEFDQSYTNAELRLDVEIRNTRSQQLALQVEVYVTDIEIEEKEDYLMECKLVALDERSTSVSLEAQVKKPTKWSCENPFLYTGLIVLKNHRGGVVEVKRFRFGFRTIEIKDSLLLLNGQAILLKGIRRFDFDPNTGIGISRERYEEDIKLLKKNNINAVSTSHLPCSPIFYEFCDKYGIYVMDEVYEEDSVSEEERFEHLERVAALIKRDRNHPCVLVWSLGQEEDFDSTLEVKSLALSYDSTRPIHFESNNLFGLSDFISQPDADRDYLDDIGLEWEKYNKPAFLTSFAPVNENGLGNLKMYIDVFEKYPNWCGGFLHEFADQAYKNNSKNYRWSMNGSIPELSGILLPDRTLHPSAHEVKKVYQNIEVREVDLLEDMIQIINKNHFTDLKHVYCLWEVLEDGEVLRRGVLDEIDVPAKESLILRLPIESYSKMEGAEYHLNLTFCLKEDTGWGNLDDIIGWEQLILPTVPRKIEKKSSEKEVNYQNRKIKVEVFGDDFSIRISKLTGDVTSIVYGQRELLVSPLRLNFYRVATDNDILHAEEHKRIRILPEVDWKKVNESYKVKDVTIEHRGNEIVVRVLRKIKYMKNDTVTEYTIDGDGNMVVFHQLTPKRNLIKFGTTMDVLNEFCEMTWFGKGFHENYLDRREGAKVGVYSCNIAEFIHAYLRPQENSNRTDVRWFSATNSEGEGLLIEDASKTLLNISAWPYTMKDLDQAQYSWDLRIRDTITINIDYQQKGVGHDRRTSENLFKNNTYQYSYRICRAF